MSDPKQEPWLELDDPHLTSTELAARVEERLHRRREELGAVTRSFPTFEAPASGPGTSGEVRDAALHQLLNELAAMPPPATQSALAPSPATRLPLLGPLWALIRNQAHQLVLFYVNRQVAHQARVNHLLSTALHEVAARLAAQQEEIEGLRKRLDRLESSDDKVDE
jgi:hypothetical protein